MKTIKLTEENWVRHAYDGEDGIGHCAMGHVRAAEGLNAKTADQLYRKTGKRWWRVRLGLTCSQIVRLTDCNDSCLDHREAAAELNLVVAGLKNFPYRFEAV